MLKTVLRTLLLLNLLALPAAVGQTTQPAGEARTTASGLKIIEVKTLTEPMVATKGDTVWVHYTGRLQSNNQVFDSSLSRGQPIDFPLGEGRVISGWDEGIAGMKVGEKRQLIIPPSLGYGDRGAGGVIPPGATLIFDVELIGIYRPEAKPGK